MRTTLAITILLLGTAANAANQHSARLYAMPQAEQYDTWRKLLVSSGEKCTAVIKTMYQGSSTGGDMWSVGCGDGNEYAVLLKSDEGGSTKILSCDELRHVDNALTSPEKRSTGKSGCWTRY